MSLCQIVINNIAAQMFSICFKKLVAYFTISLLIAVDTHKWINFHLFMDELNHCQSWFAWHFKEVLVVVMYNMRIEFRMEF